MAHEPEDGEVVFTEEAEHSWVRFLTSFRRDVMPVFERHGITNVEVAMQLFMLNKVNNNIETFLDSVEPE